jgi:hypothetical protein
LSAVTISDWDKEGRARRKWTEEKARKQPALGTANEKSVNVLGLICAPAIRSAKLLTTGANRVVGAFSLGLPSFFRHTHAIALKG